MSTELVVGFLLGLIIGGLAWRLKALTSSGALAAALVGGLVFGLGGLPWALLLLAFFLSSSALSRLFATRKERTGEKFAKGARRDWAQVLANGGIGALLAVVHSLEPQALWPWAAYCGAMAAVTADTWATELGVLSKPPARLVTTGEVVETGTSGAVTPLGLGASLAGAGLIGVFGWALAPRLISIVPFLGAVLLAGSLASLFDSLLGATLQATYTCPVCGVETERHPRHNCVLPAGQAGSETVHIRGWRWLNNDLVNLAAATFGAGLAVILIAGLGGV